MGPQHLQDKLQQATETRAKAEATIAQTDSDLKKCSDALDAMKEKLAQRNMTKRTITDNIRYREGLGEILALENEIKKREKHISSTLPQVNIISQLRPFGPLLTPYFYFIIMTTPERRRGNDADPKRV
jgi:chromosome segregation ATPase